MLKMAPFFIVPPADAAELQKGFQIERDIFSLFISAGSRCFYTLTQRTYSLKRLKAMTKTMYRRSAIRINVF